MKLQKINFKNLKPLAVVAAVLFLIILIIGYTKFFSGNVKEDGYVYIPTGATYAQVLDSLKPHVKDLASFEFIASKRDYPNLIKAGKYKLNEGESNYTIVDKLRGGLQEEQKLVLKSYSNIYTMAGKVSQVLEIDSTQIINTIVEKAKAKNIKDIEEFKLYFIPNTYNFYWNVSADKFISRMESEYDKFWTKARIQKAEDLNLSKKEVVTLASIVQRETIKSDEQPKVAGLYLNRIRKGMRLESDPTIIYALQKEKGFDLVIKRVLNKDLQIDSPYNTYKRTGLPPFPICMPSIKAVDAVLSPHDNDYIFMCAQPGYTGYHNFAVNYPAHLANAKLYTEFLNQENIKR